MVRAQNDELVVVGAVDGGVGAARNDAFEGKFKCTVACDVSVLAEKRGKRHKNHKKTAYGGLLGTRGASRGREGAGILLRMFREEELPLRSMSMSADSIDSCAHRMSHVRMAWDSERMAYEIGRVGHVGRAGNGAGAQGEQLA